MASDQYLAGLFDGEGSFSIEREQRAILDALRKEQSI